MNFLFIKLQNYENGVENGQINNSPNLKEQQIVKDKSKKKSSKSQKWKKKETDEESTDQNAPKKEVSDAKTVKELEEISLDREKHSEKDGLEENEEYSNLKMGTENGKEMQYANVKNDANSERIQENISANDRVKITAIKSENENIKSDAAEGEKIKRSAATIRIGHFADDHFLAMQYGELIGETVLYTSDNNHSEMEERPKRGGFPNLIENPERSLSEEKGKESIDQMIKMLNIGIYANEIWHRLRTILELKPIWRELGWTFERNWEEIAKIEIPWKWNNEKWGKIEGKLAKTLVRIVAKMDGIPQISNEEQNP